MRNLWVAALLSVVLASCSAQDEVSLGSGSPGSGGGTDSGTPAEGTEEVSVPQGTFSLSLTTPAYATHLLHKAGSDFGAPCAVDPEAVGAARFIECEVEVEELDLMMHGLSFEALISRHNCAHVSYTPYFYLSAPAGAGPTHVAYTKNTDTGAITEDVNGFSFNGEPYCPFDYSSLNSDAPNCCTGEFTLTETTISNGNTSVSVSTNDWGGKVGNCASGAGTLGPVNDEGLPLTVYAINSSRQGAGLKISKRYEGLLGAHRSQRLATRGSTSSISVAADHPLVNQTINGSGFGFLSVFYANYYTAASWGGALPDGIVSPYYEFTCLDAAHEETAQIRLTVREWNVHGDLTLANLANADLGGLDSFSRPNNDMGDWDDAVGILSPAPPAYSGSYDPGDYLHLREGYPYQHITK